jgi:type II secretory pathway predicted ATPase ExeA
MYEKFFGLTTKPFALTPDPSFLYPSRQHAMARTMLEYGLESQAAFSLLTGDIGSGKTTLVRGLLRQLGDKVAVGFVTNTHTRFKSVHRWALSALGVATQDDSDIAAYEALVQFFIGTYGKGRRTLLVFDEAQNLSIEALEELRLLSNVNSERDLVLQIVLVGQPELRDKLSQPELRQFAQRVSVEYQLKPLNRSETHAYILHRLKVAGRNTPLFRRDAIDFIHVRANGVPRLVNLLCDYALVYAFAEQRTVIDLGLVAELVRDSRSVRALATVPPPVVTDAINVEHGGAA